MFEGKLIMASVAITVLLLSNAITGAIVYRKTKDYQQNMAMLRSVQEKLQQADQLARDLEAKIERNTELQKAAAQRELTAQMELDQLRQKNTELANEIERREAAKPLPVGCPDNGQFSPAELDELQPAIRAAAGRGARAGSAAPGKRGVRKDSRGPKAPQK